ncbi:hypothetical protein C5E12_09440 [Rathayibacter rathayi]|nr:hypothetical protein C5E12_09440 [Rathayibacter rathayi]
MPSDANGLDHLRRSPVSRAPASGGSFDRRAPRPQSAPKQRNTHGPADQTGPNTEVSYRSGSILSGSISFRRVTQRFGATTVFQDDSFELSSGLTFLVGRNGAGKSTLIRLATGLQRPDAGEIRIFSDRTRSITQETKRRFGLQLQNDAFLKSVRVREYVDLYRTMYLTRTSAPTVDLTEVADLLDIASIAGAYAAALSGGQKKRLSLFLAIIGRKELLILDEPTAGIDIDVTDRIMRVIRLLQRQNVDLLVSSHDLSEFFEIADNVLVVDHGIQFDGSRAEFLATYGYTHKVIVPTRSPQVGLPWVQHEDGISYFAFSGEELREFFPDQPLVATTAKDLYQLATRADDRRMT